MVGLLTMIGSSIMEKVHRGRWLLFALSALLLLTLSLLTQGVGDLFAGEATASAAGSRIERVKEDCTDAYHKPSFGSPVVVNSGEVICSNVTSFGGNIVVRGEVRGDIVAFGGNVVIDGTIQGEVFLYGGDATLQNNAHINGNIHLCGGRWIHGTDSKLHGSVVECTKSVGLLILENRGGSSFHFWSLLTWIVLGLFLTSLLPEHVILVRTTVKSKLRRSFALGLLSILLAPAIVAVAIALIISIPLAIIVVVGLIAAWALGTVAIGWLVGEYLMSRFIPQYSTRPMQVVVGLAVLTLAGSLPYVGWLIGIGAGMLGLGAVFLSRFGTRLYSQPKQPLPL
jgi:hypothetical protein